MYKTSLLNHSATHILALTLLCLVLFFFRLGSYALWDIDEGLHASTSKEMVLSGDWITPKVNGENFYDKPALFNWFAAVSFILFGFTEFAARLPAALLGWGGVITTYCLGRRMFQPQTGFLSAAILATSVEYLVLSRVVVHDISLTFFITLALTLFYFGYLSEKTRRRNFLFGYAALGVAALAKGPVGLLLPMMVIGLFLIFEKNIGFLKKMHVGWGILLIIAVAAPWYVLISLQNPDYFEYFFLKQNFGSFFDDVASQHPEPLYYYLPILFGGFAPWSLFLPVAIYHALRKQLNAPTNGILYILIWFAAIFVFFTLASSKLGTYILPLFPALSLLVGAFWYDFMATQDRAPHHTAAVCSFVPLVVIFPAAFIYLWLYPPMEVQVKFGFDLGLIRNFLILASGVSFFSCILLLKRKYPAFLFSVTILFVIVPFFIFQFIMPTIGPYRSTKGPAQKIDQILPPQEPLFFYSRTRTSALFYTHRKAVVLDFKNLEDLMASEKTVYCIITRKDWDREVKDHTQFARVIFKEGDRMIISNLRKGGDR